MITVEEALERVLSHVRVLEARDVPILDSLGQVLAADVTSGIDIPPLDNAAMDGFAVRSEDIKNASPHSQVKLKVIGTVSAGNVFSNRVMPGTAVRIMTGAPVPEGADCVVRFEDTDEEQRSTSEKERCLNEIGILHPGEHGLNIRYAGEDIRKDTTVLNKGTVIRPAEAGVLASLGMSVAKVIRRPVVAVLSTGDELTALGEPLLPGRIYNSNTYSVAALAKRYGAVPLVLNIARDTEESLVSRLEEAAGADMLVTSGGVSMGDYDMVKSVLAREGEITFWTVRMKPGKPLAFGNIRSNGRLIPHLGLPGNPVSSMITFELFARPAILKMMGKTRLDKPSVTAILEGTVKNSDGRRVYARAIVEKREGSYYARVTGPQGSGILTSMSQANGLVIVPEDARQAQSGDTVKVLMLDWNEEVEV